MNTIETIDSNKTITICTAMSEPYLKQLVDLAEYYLNKVHIHYAATGTEYLYIGNINIRYSDHNPSRYNSAANYNCINRYLTEAELQEIHKLISYPYWTKQIEFGKYFGLTHYKLKKILPADCFIEEALNCSYPNTLTKLVKTNVAIEFLTNSGFEMKKPDNNITFDYAYRPDA